MSSSLFPNEDILTKEEIQSWKGSANSLLECKIVVRKYIMILINSLKM
jgi:hypothetical protein